MSWLSRVRNVFRKDQLDQELRDELESHIDESASAREGSLPTARQRLGNVNRWQDRSRDLKLAFWLEDSLQDLRLAVRLWRRRPGVLLTAVLTIALGAGMNAAVFQAIWAVMLQPLPFPKANELMQVWIDKGKDPRGAAQTSDLERWRRDARSLAAVAAYRPWRVTVAPAQNEPRPAFAGVISRDLFSVLGVPLLAGRTFTEAEETPGNDHVVLLRENYWRTHLSGRLSAIGEDIRVNGELCRVIGIVPDTFPGAFFRQNGPISRSRVSGDPELYLPTAWARIPGMKRRLSVSTWFVIARLHPGVAQGQATGELDALRQRDDNTRLWMSPLQQERGYQVRPALLATLGASLCVLLIACANLANLLAAQAMERRLEFAVRSALGAGRTRVLRQLVMEAAVLLLCGCSAGFLLSQWIVHLIPTFAPAQLFSGVDLRPVAFSQQALASAVAFGMTIVVALAFSLLPAMKSVETAGDDHLRVKRLGLSRSSRRWANGMVAVQAALTVMVLCSAGLLLKSFQLLRSVDPGFNREQVLTVSIDLPDTLYPGRTERAQFAEQWTQRLSALPGIRAAAVANSVPLRYTTLLDLLVHVPGRAEEQLVGGRGVSSAYFDAMGLRWKEGGAFNAQRKGQIVVNEAFVRNYLGNGAATGTVLGAGKEPMTITGVVRDVRVLGLRQAATPEIYLPFSEFPLNPVDTVVRTPLPADHVLPLLRAELRSINPQLALGPVSTMDSAIDDELARPRLQTLLIGLFAVVAITLAAVGTYGVIAQNVQSRVPEFGLRAALGASSRDILRVVFIEGLRAPCFGLLIGIALSWWVTGPALNNLLFGVNGKDPQVVALCAAVIAITAALACLFPGRVAASIHPSQALRQI